jgi:hypothetical protein
VMALEWVREWVPDEVVVEAAAVAADDSDS